MVGTSVMVDHRPEVATAADAPAPSAGRAPTARPSTPAVTRPVARALTLAAAIAGMAELVLHRVVSPVISHVPGVPGGRTFVNVVATTGDATLGATAVLVPTAALALAGALWRRRPTVAVLLAGAVAYGLAFAATGNAHIGIIFYAITCAAAVAVVIASRESATGTHTVALGLFAVALIFGLWPHAAATASSAGLIQVGTGSPAIAGAVAEAAFVGAAVLFGIAAFRGGFARRSTLWIAVSAGVVTAAVLAAQPQHAAIVSLWAAGLTLSLPPLLYVLSAVSLVAAFAEWTASAARRHLAAGLALVVVAGVAPALTHHNVTALLGLAALALLHSPRPDTEEPSW